MRIRQLEYQDRVLTTFDTFIDRLKAEKKRSDAIAELAAGKVELDLPVPDFTQKAWEALRSVGKLPESRKDIPFSPRKDGCGNSVPNAVFKVPTAGGKTWLAVSGVSRIMGRYLGQNTGFVLWIVPNEAIYRQTLKHLRDRQHPYRQALDRTAAGRVLIMEKSGRLNARDVETNLCVMLLMLQSANRETRESLKMFQDRGDVHGFFPPEGEQQAHRESMELTPNLDAHGGTLFPMIKDSLGNALRITRPVVVVDEGHRAISNLAFNTLYGFNPCFVLELTATPKDVRPRGGQNPRPGRHANLLVEVTGRELDREGMIKMPLNLEPRQGTDWRATLNAALTKLNTLHAAAERLRADTNRRIRPIMLIQVERTGEDQRESGFIHSQDVKEWLLTVGFDEAEVAIKTAEQNDLNQPENQDLLSPTNRVRAIITKQALQEGWDCPFAYVLCVLAASSNPNGLTQLVGRVLRQPDAIKTGVEPLDECHIITHHARTAAVIGAIKAGLEREGLGDLTLQVAQEDGTEPEVGARKIDRRPDFASTGIYLPKVLFLDGDKVRDLDYETDVLSRVEWRGYNPESVAARIPENSQAADAQLRRLTLTEDGQELLVGESVLRSSEVLLFDAAHAVRMILDIVPNPFVGREIVGRLLESLRGRGFGSEELGGIAQLVVQELRKELDRERDARARNPVQGCCRSRANSVPPASGWPQLADALADRHYRASRRSPDSEQERRSPRKESVYAAVRERVQPRRARSRRVSRRRGDSHMVAPQRRPYAVRHPRMEEWKDLPRFHLCRTGRLRGQPHHCLGDQGRSSRQSRHRLQARRTFFPVQQLRVGRLHPSWRARIGHHSRTNPSVRAHPHERVEDEATAIPGWTYKLIRPRMVCE